MDDGLSRIYAQCDHKSWNESSPARDIEVPKSNLILQVKKNMSQRFSDVLASLSPRKKRAQSFSGRSLPSSAMVTSNAKPQYIADDTGCYRHESYRSFLSSSYKTPMAILTWLAGMEDDEVNVVQCLSELNSSCEKNNPYHFPIAFNGDEIIFESKNKPLSPSKLASTSNVVKVMLDVVCPSL